MKGELSTEQDLSPFSLEGVLLQNRYQVEEIIGEGGMALVYRATQTDVQTSVAIKVMRPETIKKENTHKERFLREAQVQSSLTHPNIVSVYEIFHERGITGFVQEWCNTGDLQQFLNSIQRPFTAEEVQRLFLPVVGAVEYAHEQRFIHRDIKPQNILLERVGQHLLPKLTDFGLVKALGMTSLTKTGTMMGTLQYMSPEQFEETKQVDKRSDVYNLGVLLYRLTTGRLPFTASMPRLMLQIIQNAPQAPKEAPKPLQSVILKAMEKQPSNRFASAKELQLAVEDALGRKVLPAPSARLALLDTSSDVSSGVTASLPMQDIAPDSGTHAQKNRGLADPKELLKRQLQGDSFAPQRPPFDTTSGATIKANTSDVHQAASGELAPNSTHKSTAPMAKRIARPKGQPKRTLSLVWLALGVLSLCGVAGLYIFFKEMPRHKPRVLRKKPHARQHLTQKKPTHRKPEPVRIARRSPMVRRPTNRRRTLPRTRIPVTHRNALRKEPPSSRPTHALDKSFQVGLRLLQRKKYILAELALRHACKYKHPQACYELGLLVKKGLGGKANLTWYKSSMKEACAIGEAKACVSLAKYFTTAKKMKVAFEYLVQGCRWGDSWSCFGAGKHRWRGKYVPKNQRMAEAHFMRSCELKNVRGCMALGVVYMRATVKALKSPRNAIHAFTKACDLNDASGCIMAARLSVSVSQTAKDCQVIEPLFRKACKLGDKDGCTATCRSVHHLTPTKKGKKRTSPPNRAKKR